MPRKGRSTSEEDSDDVIYTPPNRNTSRRLHDTVGSQKPSSITISDDFSHTAKVEERQFLALQDTKVARDLSRQSSLESDNIVYEGTNEGEMKRVRVSATVRKVVRVRDRERAREREKERGREREERGASERYKENTICGLEGGRIRST